MPIVPIPFGVLDSRYVNTGGDTMTGALTLPNTGLHILDTNASHDLIIAPGSDLDADRTLTLTTGDAARTITLSGNPTLDDWFDQSVKQAAAPTFANLIITSTGDIRPSADATNALNIAQADGTDFVTFDTTNKRIGIGTDSPSQLLDIVGGAGFQGNIRITDVETDETAKFAHFLLPQYTNSDGEWVFFRAQSLQYLNIVEYGGGTGSFDSATMLVFYTSPAVNTAAGSPRLYIIGNGNIGVNSAAPDRKLDVLDTAIQFRTTHTDGTIYTDFGTDGSGYLTITPTGAIAFLTGSFYPATDDTYYLGKNDDDTPFAWKGIILKDQGGTGKYYRLEVNGDALQIVDLTD